MMKWKSKEKIVSSMKSWAVRMPNNTVVWKPQSMQRSELLKINLFMLCAIWSKSQERGKKQYIIHSAVLGIISMPIGTQSKSTDIYSLPTMCQVLGKVLRLLDCWWTQKQSLPYGSLSLKRNTNKSQVITRERLLWKGRYTTFTSKYVTKDLF